MCKKPFKNAYAPGRFPSRRRIGDFFIDFINCHKNLLGEFDFMGCDIFFKLFYGGGANDIGGNKTAVIDKSQ